MKGLILGMALLATPAPAEETDLSGKLAAILRAQLVDGGPGCTAAIVRDGQVAATAALGKRTLTPDVAHDLDSVFELASVSKQFTGAAVALLAAEGKLSLGDPVRRFFPEMPYLPAELTVAHLLHHTGGVRDYIGLAELAGYGDDYSVAQALELIGRQRGLNFAPGTAYEYSNSGFFMLAEIVRRVTGAPFRAFAGERLFGPLGMTASVVKDDHLMRIPNATTGYVRTDGGFEPYSSTLEMVGDGSVWSTARDLVQWHRTYQDDVFGIAREMATPYVLASGRVVGYGLGIRVLERRGERVLQHSGSWVGFKAGFVTIPRLRLGAHFLCNDRAVDTGVALAALGDLLLDEGGVPAGEAPAAKACLDADCATLAGDYYGEGFVSTDRWTVTHDAARGLVATSRYGEELPLLKRDAGVFVGAIKATKYEARFDGDTLVLERPGQERAVLVKAKAWRTDPAALAALAGAYLLPEGGACVELRVAGDGLVMTGAGGTAQLKPLAPGALVDAGDDAGNWFTRLELGPPLRLSGAGLVGMELQRVERCPEHLVTPSRSLETL